MIKIFILTVFVLFISCKKKEELSKITTTKEELEIFYDIKWLENQLDSGSKELFQLYISSKKDTLYNQRKVFKNGILDTLESSFYNLDFKRSKLRNQGSLYVKSSLNSKIKNPINEKGLWLYLIQFEKDKMDVVEFHSLNSNSVEFDYKSEEDVIMGVVKDVHRYQFLYRYRHCR